MSREEMGPSPEETEIQPELPEINLAQYKKELKELNTLSDPEQNRFNNHKTNEYHGWLTGIDQDGQPYRQYVDQTFTRGYDREENVPHGAEPQDAQIKVSTKAIKDPTARFYDDPSSPEDTQAFSIAAGSRTAVIYTRNRNLAREIHDKVVKNSVPMGGSENALTAVFYEYRREKNEDHPDKPLIEEID